MGFEKLWRLSELIVNQTAFFIIMKDAIWHTVGCDDNLK